MADILHRFHVAAPAAEVFEAIATREGLNAWWTLDAQGRAVPDTSWRFFFSKDFDWKGRTVSVSPGKLIEWVFTDAEPDWTGTKLRIELKPVSGGTSVEFSHTDWNEASDHYRTSSFCWALYLRLLKRYVERGEVVPYAERDDA